MRKHIILAFLIATIANAQFSETQRQELGDVNLIENPGGENGLQRWTNSGGGTFSIESGANVGVGTRSLSWDASAASDTLTSRQASVPVGLQNRFCYASFLYKGGDTNLTAEVIDGSLTVLASKSLTAQTDYSLGELGFTCPSSGTVAFRLSASADAAIIYLDQVFVGIRATNVTHSISPTVYELGKQSQGEPGVIDNTQTAISAGDFPGAASLSSFYSLTDANDDSANGRDFTNNAVTFDFLGFYGRSVSSFDGTADLRRTSDSYFNFTPASEGFTFGGWFYRDDWEDAASTQFLIQVGDGTTYVAIDLLASNELRLADNAGTQGDRIPVDGLKGWIHVAMVIDSGNTRGYLNGKESFDVALVGSAITASAATIGEFFGGGQNFIGKAQDLFFSDQALTEAQINTLYSRRFEGKQLNGHVLTDDSFPSYTTDISYYNLNADGNDDSTNSRNLTNNGSIPFTGTDIFGVSGAASFDGTTQYFSSSDAFFNPGGPFSTGAWVTIDSLNETIISQVDTNSDRAFSIDTSLSNEILFSATNAASPSSYAIILSTNPVVTLGEWIHIVMSYDGSTVRGYINGVLEVSGSLSDLNAVATPKFNLMATQNGVIPTEGKMEQAFFASRALSDAEIKRIYSAKITHNKNVPVENQTWLGSFFSEQNDYVGEFDQDWFVHKTANAVYVDPGLLPEQQLSLKMQNHSFTSTTVPVETYNTGLLSAAPSFPINHGLPCSPSDFYVLTEGQTTAGDWDKRYDLLSADSATILGDVSSLTIDGSHRLQIIASCAPVALALDLENADLLITNNTLTKDLIIGSGKTFFRPNLEIASGNTLTVNGTFNTVGEITGSGTLAGTGTVSSIDEQQVYPLDKTFQGDVTVEGILIASPVLPTAMNNADAAKMGYKQYDDSVVTVTSNSGLPGFSVQRAVFIPYQMQDGTWRLKFNIRCPFTTASVTTEGISISGVTFNISYDQAVTGFFTGSTTSSFSNALTQAGTDNINVSRGTASNHNAFVISGDVELDAKPSWAD